MRYRAVHWSEGMFLRPQHFQSADRYLHELIAISDEFDHAYNYGFVSVTISEQALANYQLEITGCQARMRDGTVISFDAQHVDRVDLKNGLHGPEGLDELLLAHDLITVYLAIPKLVEGRRNVGVSGNNSQERYVSFDLQMDDESAGGNRQELSYRDANIKILLSTDERDGYDCLALCRVRKSTQGDAVPVLDRDYFPPCLAIDAWPELGIQIVRAIYDMISERVDSLSQQIKDRNITLSSPHPGDLEQMFLVNALNEGLGTLNCLAFGRGVHPFVAYTALCSLIGRLSIFGSEVRAPEFPRYDHDDLATIFKWAMRQIELLIYQRQQTEYVQRYFKGAGRGMQVTLEPSWFSAEWTWYMGVNSGQMPADDCFRLLASGKIDWKLGSASKVDYLFQQRAQGVILHPVKQAPRQLPTQGNWIYFSIPKDNPEWQNVKVECNLGMRIKEEQIHNRNELEGQQKILISVDGELVGLEFAIFAVKVQL